jgi:hypothetical protein
MDSLRWPVDVLSGLRWTVYFACGVYKRHESRDLHPRQDPTFTMLTFGWEDPELGATWGCQT